MERREFLAAMALFASAPTAATEKRSGDRGMIKHVVLVKFRSDVPRAELIDRYETDHVPLVRSLLPFFSDYRRNYVVDHPMMSRGREGESDFDVVTQLWYSDAQQLLEVRRALADPATETAILNSEARLFDPGTMTILECEEYVTPVAMLQPRPAGHVGRPAVKLIGLIRRKAGMTRERFIDRYENGHCALALSVLTKHDKPTFAEYRRTYPLPSQTPAIDVMTEVWFWTEADFQHFLAQRADPRVDAALSRDEAELFDRASIAMYFVDERI